MPAASPCPGFCTSMGLFSAFSKTKREKPLVLHIDDDEINRVLVEETLVKMGVDIIGAPNPVDGINMAAKELPDLILLDIEMPGMNGYDACASIKGNPKLAHIPILMLTGLGQVKSVEKALACGANGYISKPFDLNRLCATVKKWLEKPEAGATPAPK